LRRGARLMAVGDTAEAAKPDPWVSLGRLRRRSADARSAPRSCASAHLRSALRPAPRILFALYAARTTR
jgi:hypothetical protein